MNGWDCVTAHTAIALGITQKAPILPWEKDAAGNVLAMYKDKARQTCWTAFHDGEEFQGPFEPFGRLAYYYNKDVHPLAPTTSPGIFIGWRLESGMRFRNVLLIADYDKVRLGVFKAEYVKKVPTKEVFFPEKLVFPFAQARHFALENMVSLKLPQRAPELQLPPLPFDDETIIKVVKPDVCRRAPSALPPVRFKITQKRIIEYGSTPGCNACSSVFPGLESSPHSPECRQRLGRLLREMG